MKSIQAKMLLLLIPGTFLLFTGAVAFLGYDTSGTITDYAYRAAAQYAREGASRAENNQSNAARVADSLRNFRLKGE